MLKPRWHEKIFNHFYGSHENQIEIQYMEFLQRWKITIRKRQYTHIYGGVKWLDIKRLKTALSNSSYKEVYSGHDAVSGHKTELWVEID